MDTIKYRLAQQNALMDPFKRHSVNFDSYNYEHANRPANNNRLSNEKILSYSYYTNQNYDQKQRNKKLIAAAAVVASAASKDSLFGTSLNSLNTSSLQKKLEPNLKMNSTANGNTIANISSQQNNQDTIFQKIMNKLSEFPDSTLLNNKNLTNIKGNNDRYKSNPAISNMGQNDSNNHNNINNNNNSHFDSSGLGLIKENAYGYRNNREPSKRTSLLNDDSKRSKYKSKRPSN